MDAVLGGVEDVSLTVIAEAVGVNDKHLYSGRKKWKAYIDGDPMLIEPHLKDRHGNAWPIEWVEFMQAMWLHESVMRKGEGGGDYGPGGGAEVGHYCCRLLLAAISFFGQVSFPFLST